MFTLMMLPGPCRLQASYATNKKAVMLSLPKHFYRLSNF